MSCYVSYLLIAGHRDCTVTVEPSAVLNPAATGTNLTPSETTSKPRIIISDCLVVFRKIIKIGGFHHNSLILEWNLVPFRKIFKSSVFGYFILNVLFRHVDGKFKHIMGGRLSKYHPIHCSSSWACKAVRTCGVAEATFSKNIIFFEFSNFRKC